MDSCSPLPCSLRQIQYLVAVADCGGFRKAAEACHVSQPSLSAQVARAEAALGVQIFERSRRGVRTAAAGAPVLEQARRILMAARDFEDVARRAADPFRGTFRVGVIPTVCPYLLPDVTPALASTYPDLRIEWREDRTGELVRLVREGQLDAAVLALDADIGSLDHALIGRDPFMLAAAPGHPLLRSRRPAHTDTLDGASVLLLEDGHCFRDQALAVCARAGAAETTLRATSLSTLVQMVSASDGVTLLPALAVAVENRRGQLAVRPFARPGPARTIVLSWRKGSARAAALMAIAATLRKQLGAATHGQGTSAPSRIAGSARQRPSRI